LSELVLVGVNHKKTPVELRECLAFSDQEKAPFLERLRADGRARGAVLLSTCNRVELYADLSEGTTADQIIGHA